MKSTTAYEIENLFKKITPQIIDLVNKNFEKTTISTTKIDETDYATGIDIESEKIIVEMIKKMFPGDDILAEEGYSDSSLDFIKRTWIIDPICGTNNLMRGTRFFCSNIAVVENQQLIASCVIDHSKGQVIWSTGDGEVYINDDLFTQTKKDEGLKLDVDFGSVFKLDEIGKKRYLQFIEHVVMEKGIVPTSMNSSLGFAYTALGINDGFYCAKPMLWDVAAAVFLIRQSGGVVTDSQGQEWDLKSPDAVGCLVGSTHTKLLNLLQ